jgi:hypothetical protein
MRIDFLKALVLAAGLAIAGCQVSMNPDAGQGAPAAPAQPAASTPPAAPRGRGVQPQVPANLERAMSEMDAMLRAIKADAADPAKAETTLHNIAIMARDVAISKLQTPPWVARMAAADEKAKAMASYRSMMNGLTRTLLELEDAVNDKKPDAIKKAIAQLEEIEKAGHEEFHVAH